MNDLVLAFFITWTTYGTWLPGDRRGWAKKKVWRIQQPNPELERACRERMTEDAVILTWEQRQIVDAVIAGNAKPVEDFRAGKQEALKFLVGQAMKETRGRANPATLTEILKAKLEA